MSLLAISEQLRPMRGVRACGGGGSFFVRGGILRKDTIMGQLCAYWGVGGGGGIGFQILDATEPGTAVRSTDTKDHHAARLR